MELSLFAYIIEHTVLDYYQLKLDKLFLQKTLSICKIEDSFSKTMKYRLQKSFPPKRPKSTPTRKRKKVERRRTITYILFTRLFLSIQHQELTFPMV